MGGALILPTCKEASTAFARGDYAEASPLARLRVRLHLLICRHCRRFRAQLELLERALKAAVFPKPDPRRVAALERAALQRLRGP